MSMHMKATWLGVLALLAAGCGSTPKPVAPVSKAETIRISRHGLAAEYVPVIDRLTFFGRASGRNLLHVTDLDRDVPADGSYVFWGGCYSWVSPQKGVEGTTLGWVDADRVTKKDWPPDPAMDVGPARRAGQSPDSFAFFGPDMRSGLREEKSFRLVSADSAEWSFSLLNRGAASVTAGTWTNTAARPGDVIAVKIPTGTDVWGWDQASVDSFRSITGEADARGWAIVELGRAKWEGGIKVYLSLPAGESVARAEIAVWRRGAKAWLHRSLAPMSAASAARLREVGEGPVAVYIQPNGGRDPIVEAELYGPVDEIAPNEKITTVETWRVIECDRADTSVLP